MLRKIKILYKLLQMTYRTFKLIALKGNKKNMPDDKALRIDLWVEVEDKDHFVGKDGITVPRTYHSLALSGGTSIMNGSEDD